MNVHFHVIFNLTVCQKGERKRETGFTGEKAMKGRDLSNPCLASIALQEEEAEENEENRGSESKNRLEKTRYVVQYLDDLVTVCSNIAPWLLGLREEQSGSETDSEISVSGQHSVYPSVCLSVYLTVKLSLSANSSP